jgi:hypothetical protein
MFLALLTIFTIVSAGPIQKTDDVRFTFRNNCGFDVYVREAVAQHPSPRPDETCQNYGESPDVLIKGGSEYYTTFPVLKDSCGHSGPSHCSTVSCRQMFLLIRTHSQGHALPGRRSLPVRVQLGARERPRLVQLEPRGRQSVHGYEPQDHNGLVSDAGVLG